MGIFDVSQFVNDSLKWKEVLECLFLWALTAFFILLIYFLADWYNIKNTIHTRSKRWKFILCLLFFFPFLYTIGFFHINVFLPVQSLSGEYSILSRYGLLGFWIVYCVGFFCAFSRFLLKRRDLSSFLKTSEACHCDWITECVHEMVSKLGINKNIQIRIHQGDLIPCIIDGFRPILLIPAYCVTDWSKEQLKPVIIHELNHIKFGDFFYTKVMELVTLFLWFFPGIYMLRKQMNLCRERLNDEESVKHCSSPAEYAQSFLLLLECAKRQQYDPLHMNFASRNEAVYRFKKIFEDPPVPNRISRALEWTCLVCVIAFTFFAGNFHFSYAQDDSNSIEAVAIPYTINEVMFPEYPVPSPVAEYNLDLKEQSDEEFVEGFTEGFYANHTLWYRKTIDSIVGFQEQNGNFTSSPSVEIKLPSAKKYSNRTGQSSEALSHDFIAANDSFLILTTRDKRAGMEGFLENQDLEGGIYLIDITDPLHPILSTHIPAQAAGGITLFEDTLIAQVTLIESYYDDMFIKSTNYLIEYDLSDWKTPRERWRYPLPDNQYIYSACFHPGRPDILFAGGSDLLVFEIAGETIDLKHHWSIAEEQYHVINMLMFPNHLVISLQSKGTMIFDGEVMRYSALGLIPLDYEGDVPNMQIYPLMNRDENRSVLIKTNVHDRFIFTVTSTQGLGNFYTAQLFDDSGLLPIAFFPLGTLNNAVIKDGERIFLGENPVQVYESSSFSPAVSVYNWKQLDNFVKL